MRQEIKKSCAEVSVGHKMFAQEHVLWGNPVSVLGQIKGYIVKYSPSPKGVPKGTDRGNSGRQMAIFNSLSKYESSYGQYIILISSIQLKKKVYTVIWAWFLNIEVH